MFNCYNKHYNIQLSTHPIVYNILIRYQYCRSTRKGQYYTVITQPALPILHQTHLVNPHNVLTAENLKYLKKLKYIIKCRGA